MATETGSAETVSTATILQHIVDLVDFITFLFTFGTKRGTK